MASLTSIEEDINTILNIAVAGTQAAAPYVPGGVLAKVEGAEAVAAGLIAIAESAINLVKQRLFGAAPAAPATPAAPAAPATDPAVK